MALHIDIDDRQMRRFVRDMPRAGTRSVTRSLNKAITMTRTQAAREISGKRNLKVGRARKDMRIYKANYSKPVASIVVKDEPVPVIDVMGPKRQTLRGVTARLQKGAKPHLFENAFIAKMDSGHVGVFQRRGRSNRVSSKDSPGTQRKNLPIYEVRLPSVAATLVQHDIDTKLRAFAAPIYEKELIRLLELEMQRAGAR